MTIQSIIEPQFWVYAGQGDKCRSIDDAFALDVRKWEWRRMFFRVKVPLARQHFSFIPRGNKEEDMILFGG